MPCSRAGRLPAAGGPSPPAPPAHPGEPRTSESNITATITTVDGQHAVVDDAFAFLARWTWQAHVAPNGRTTVTEVGTSQHPLGWIGPALRRVVTGARPGQRVSHLNGDGLDCRRENLKVTGKPHQTSSPRLPR